MVMATTTNQPQTTSAPVTEISVTARLILNRLHGLHGKTDHVALISGRDLTVGAASKAYDEAVKHMIAYRDLDGNTGRAWEAWCKNEVRFKF